MWLSRKLAGAGTGRLRILVLFVGGGRAELLLRCRIGRRNCNYQERGSCQVDEDGDSPRQLEPADHDILHLR